jgi:copper chaperone
MRSSSAWWTDERDPRTAMAGPRGARIGSRRNYAGRVTPPSPSHEAPADQANADDTATAELAVDGMHCNSCVALIEETLTEQVGVTSASVDLDSARAVIDYDPSLLGVDDLRSTIAEAGYSATPVG